MREKMLFFKSLLLRQLAFHILSGHLVECVEFSKMEASLYAVRGIAASSLSLLFLIIKYYSALHHKWRDTQKPITVLLCRRASLNWTFTTSPQPFFHVYTRSRLRHDESHWKRSDANVDFLWTLASDLRQFRCKSLPVRLSLRLACLRARQMSVMPVTAMDNCCDTAVSAG